MPTNVRCMAIIVPDETEEQPDVLKEGFYYAALRSGMVRGLIGIGIQKSCVS